MQRYLIGVFVLLSVVAGCTDTGEKDGRLYIVTTTGMIADVVRNIAGDKAIVEELMGPGVDPHLYKASQGDLGKLKKADIIFYNGLHLEGKMGELFESLSEQRKVIPVADGIDKGTLIQIEKNIPDPHIWFDVKLWAEAVRYAGEALINADPANADFYRKNLEAYLASLAELDLWVKNEIATIPEGQRILITAHDAFNYFGRAYSIRVEGLQGISTLAESGLKDRTRMVDLIVGQKIKAVFVESSVSDKSLRAVMEGSSLKGHDVKLGGMLFSDAMGAKNTPEGTYVGMVKANVTTIVSALK
ncbi:MAG: zinc ABC transporter substrate-binding protein [Bacteroidota bacterium]|nr:zinc ABC transporter substrate-binding protein [Bacteroidota bacterium]